MKKSILRITLVAVLCITCNQAFSQTTNISVIDSAATIEPKLKFGCGFGLNFLGGTNITLSPNLRYAISDKFNLGAGIQGSYTSIKDVQKTTTFGANIITEYIPTRKFTTLLEFAQLKVNNTRETPTGEVKDDFWESALFVGAGFNINNKITIGAKYNVLYDDDESVYTSPIIPFVNISF
ncbi:hypothetical protein SAMN04488009_3690 [Maribacter sedimenticola]|uniref:Outer membrane protein beta-barrel domain-containing protein n=1 Tax=Maribacter sedimenticola TaxID=228956 RepID=A0ABY1SLN1_9FLAO|nr:MULTISPECIES: hypothetical protein [Maribacter]TVZ15059.1 hypothetical protein JM81_1278 [Maribacter sp. MAR_2009_72]SNR77005.1 hypothetical protein SAMN04488009_3690 [Maribacter sedimenticola]